MLRRPCVRRCVDVDEYPWSMAPRNGKEEARERSYPYMRPCEAIREMMCPVSSRLVISLQRGPSPVANFTELQQGIT
jgi:hypothetical protein